MLRCHGMHLTFTEQYKCPVCGPMLRKRWADEKKERKRQRDDDDGKVDLGQQILMYQQYETHLREGPFIGVKDFHRKFIGDCINFNTWSGFYTRFKKMLTVNPEGTKETLYSMAANSELQHKYCLTSALLQTVQAVVRLHGLRSVDGGTGKAVDTEAEKAAVVVETAAAAERADAHEMLVVATEEGAGALTSQPSPLAPPCPPQAASAAAAEPDVANVDNATQPLPPQQQRRRPVPLPLPLGPPQTGGAPQQQRCRPVPLSVGPPPTGGAPSAATVNGFSSCPRFSAANSPRAEGMRTKNTVRGGAGKGACPICTDTRCHQVYGRDGRAQERTSRRNARGGFEVLAGPVWRNMSCPFDGVLAPYQCIRCNLTARGQAAFDTRYSPIAPLMQAVTDGTMNNIEYKKAIEHALHHEIWRNGTAADGSTTTTTTMEYAKIRKHSMDGTAVAFKVLDRLRCQGEPDDLDNDAADPFCCTRFRYRFVCGRRKDKDKPGAQKCGHEWPGAIAQKLRITMSEVNKFIADPTGRTLLGMLDGDDVQLEKCPKCRSVSDTREEDLVVPMLLRLDFGFLSAYDNDLSACDILPATFNFGGWIYHLVAVTYGGHGHFTSCVRIGRHFFSHDGMLNDGIFVRSKSSRFSATSNSKRAVHLYYVRGDVFQEDVE
jgi:hypothetical protein